MIQKLRVGEKYCLIGSGNWSDVKLDVVVLGITIYSQLNPQDIDIYSDWFKEYGLEENVFEEMMQDDPYIYHCRKLISRDPVLETNTGDEIYLFPGLINYQESSKLLESKILSFKVTLDPFQVEDELYPYKHITDGQIKIQLKDLMRSLVYDGVSTKNEERDILISEEEYKKLTESRMRVKTTLAAKNSSEESNIAEERAHMYSVMESNRHEAERLRIYSLSLQNREKDVSSKWSDVVSLQEKVNAKEIFAQEKYNKALEIIAKYNAKALSSDKIDAPSWDNL